jgi:hypothetical protein
MARLRAETCAILDGLDEAAKGRASIVRSCSESRSLFDVDREALKDLLRCITEQRKRLRALRRLWQSLDVFERPSAGLVDATELCLRESHEMAAALEPWRVRTIGQVSQTVSTTWARLVAAAAHFTPAAATAREPSFEHQREARVASGSRGSVRLVPDGPAR